MKSSVFKPAVGDIEGQTVAVEGIHEPDQPRDSGVWISPPAPPCCRRAATS